ncbi:hypothetical protein ACFY7F_00330 [Streptomyces griseofuscus]|uniref:hypothetical protein n=1 Tax=Streptomyces griseofuscus TaxID=146922 RepID=UPI0036BF09D0
MSVSADPAPPTAVPMTSRAGGGRLAAFLISGFAIRMSCWGRTPAQFAVSRIARLFPLYWTVVLVIVVVAWIARLAGQRPGAPVDLRTTLGNLTMLPGPLGLRTADRVAWTLWVEARFYLLMAVLLLIGWTTGSPSTRPPRPGAGHRAGGSAPSSSRCSWSCSRCPGRDPSAGCAGASWSTRAP